VDSQAADTCNRSTSARPCPRSSKLSSNAVSVSDEGIGCWSWVVCQATSDFWDLGGAASDGFFCKAAVLDHDAAG
jgi:hypothetical protein